MRIGLGGGALGTLDTAAADRLLDAARALGVTLVDVARSYGGAEAHLARWQRANGAPLRVVTKGGYGIEGVEDWTGAAVRAGVEAATAALGPIWAFLLHSCPPHVLDRDDVREALAWAGARVERLGYSGDNDDLHGALDRAGALGFRVIEQSLSLLDGKARVHTLPRSRAAGLAVIAKRALANAPWRPGPRSPDAERQRARLARADLPDVGLPLDELFLRYAAYTPGVHTVLVGTSKPAALEHAVACAAKGPLGADVHRALADALARCDDDAMV